MIPWVVLERLFLYYTYLESLPPEVEWVSSQMLGDALGISGDLVRKDMTYCTTKGKPRQGYPVGQLRDHLREMLKLDLPVNAVLVGAGRLGSALANYPGFRRHNMHILAAFDVDPAKVGTHVGDVPVLPITELESFVTRNDVCCGIITVPASSAQEVADMLVRSGVRSIWNFAPVSLRVPHHVVVRNENIIEGFILLRIQALEQ
ncbi:redox-sensing transcriptional repressor Rex [Coprothermobacteraceae bacterium]|nr:redox-sensing transcriptional repressor Rex [Coprothermobacteraceae bacterium]